MEAKTAIEQAIEIVGSQSKLAAAIDCNKTQVNHWIPTPSKPKPVPIPIHRCIAIERVSGISRKRLNPAIDWSMFSSEPPKAPRRSKAKAEA